MANIEQRSGGDHAAVISHNARWGLILFALYVALYLGFMIMSAYFPEKMSQPSIAGVNLAIVYGIGLIVAALFLAIVYTFLARSSDAV